MTEEELRDRIRRLETGPAAQVTEAVNTASRASGISANLILGYTRRPDVARARHAAMMLAHEAGVSKADIGVHMNRDHTTVIYGIRKALKLFDERKVPVFRTTRLNTDSISGNK